jgi:hypothetical protein
VNVLRRGAYGEAYICRVGRQYQTCNCRHRTASLSVPMRAGYDGCCWQCS